MMEKSMNDVLRAWTVPGRSLSYHQKMQRKLRREWPVLAQALDRLAKESAGANGAGKGIPEDPVYGKRANNGPKRKKHDDAPVTRNSSRARHVSGEQTPRSQQRHKKQ